MSAYPIIWVLGGPGCGKGTQCERMAERYGFVHLSTGDLLRQEVAAGSRRGKRLQKIMVSGGLVPTSEMLELLTDAINKQKDTAKGFLIDGFPREKSQGIEFEAKIGTVDMILYFECKDQTLINRVMARAKASTVKRADDNEETIKQRLITFRRNIAAVLAQFPKRMITINGERNVDEIFKEVVCVTDCMLKKREKLLEALKKKQEKAARSRIVAERHMQREKQRQREMRHQ